MYAFGYVFEEFGSNLFIRWILFQVNRYEQLFGLLVNISYINATFMCEKNPVTLMPSVDDSQCSN